MLKKKMLNLAADMVAQARIYGMANPLTPYMTCVAVS